MLLSVTESLRTKYSLQGHFFALNRLISAPPFQQETTFTAVRNIRYVSPKKTRNVVPTNTQNTVQATLVTRVFAHLWYYFSQAASISYSPSNFKVYYLRRTFSRLIRERDAGDRLSIKGFWRQFNNRKGITVSRFARFRYTRWFSGMQPPHLHLYD
jgi:hypothetical protein